MGVWDGGEEGVKINEIMTACDPNHLHSRDFMEVPNICGLYVFIYIMRIFAHRIVKCKRTVMEGNGNPLQFSCLENPRDGGAWWSADYGVAQSWTRLK